MVARSLTRVACCLAIVGVPAVSAGQVCNGAGIFVSTFAVAGLGVYDIASAPSSVRRYNQTAVVVAPYVSARDRSFGVSVSWAVGRSRPAPPPILRRSPMIQDTVRPHKSPAVGFALSLLSTGVPMAAGAGLGGSAGGATAFLAGVVVGPSVGHFYAGRIWRGVGTAALRAAGLGAFIASAAGCFDD